MSAKTISLSHLERVDLREVWDTEPQAFTPWLALEANLSLLSEALNLDLQLEAVEKNIGPFRADMLCTDRKSDRRALIENQLEKSDHVHLGQILTYAAGLDTNIIIWVAKKFTDEHRAALDWLNSVSATGKIHFFGVEIELWKIGDSNPALKFNVVAQPNDWKNQVVEASQPFLKRKSIFRFSLVDILPGSTLHFIRDSSKTCRVLEDDRSIEFEGQKTSLSGAASQLLRSLGWKSGNCTGPNYWTYEGEALDERRKRFEKEGLV